MIPLSYSFIIIRYYARTDHVVSYAFDRFFVYTQIMAGIPLDLTSLALSLLPSLPLSVSLSLSLPLSLSLVNVTTLCEINGSNSYYTHTLSSSIFISLT